MQRLVVVGLIATAHIATATWRSSDASHEDADRHSHVSTSKLVQAAQEVRHEFADLRRDMSAARLSSQRSELTIRTQIEQVRAKLSAEKAEDSQLDQLVSHDEDTSSQAAGNHDFVSRLAAAATQQNELRAQLEGVKARAATEKAQLHRQASLLSDDIAETRAQLKQGKAHYDMLQVKFSQQVLDQKEASLALHKDRLKLLNNISELQIEVQQKQQQSAALQDSTETQKQDLETRQKAEKSASLQQSNALEKGRSSLAEALQATKAKATAAESAAVQAKHKSEVLRGTVDSTSKKLKTALATRDELMHQRDAEARTEETTQAKKVNEESLLQENQDQKSSLQSDYQSVKTELASSSTAVAGLSKRRDVLEKQLTALQTSSGKQLGAAQALLRSTNANVAGKLHQLEAQREKLNSSIQQTEADLARSSADAQRAKDTLMEETDASLKANQNAAELDDEASSAEEAAGKSEDRLKQVQDQVTRLKTERDHLGAAALKERKTGTEWQTKASLLQHSVNHATEVAANLSTADGLLQDQVTELSGENARIGETTAELADLKSEAKQNASRSQGLSQELQQLRNLRDAFSTQYEQAQNESNTWHAKSDSLAQQFAAVDKELKVVVAQRDSLQQRSHRLRGVEDEYYENNEKLQQESADLKENIKKASVVVDTHEITEQAVRAEEERVQQEETQKEQTRHAAWAKKEHSLEQIELGSKQAQMYQSESRAELGRLHAVLTNVQRKRLGLPPAPVESKAKHVAAKGGARHLRSAKHKK